jgi:hypothetical protein
MLDIYLLVCRFDAHLPVMLQAEYHPAQGNRLAGGEMV